MKNIHALTLLVLAILGSAVVGCGPKKPADMPKLAPFTVKVVDGDKPVENVRILFLQDGKSNTTISGITDKEGVATITTTLQKYTEKGAPVGEFRVQCTKERLAEHWKTPEEQSQMSKPEKDAYLDEWLAKCDEIPKEIPDVWGDFDKTPLAATVPDGGGEVTFDVDGQAGN